MFSPGDLALVKQDTMAYLGPFNTRGQAWSTGHESKHQSQYWALDKGNIVVVIALTDNPPPGGSDNIVWAEVMVLAPCGRLGWIHADSLWGLPR